MPRIQSTLVRDYQSFTRLPPDERRACMDSWKRYERSVEDGSYHAATMRGLKDHRSNFGRTSINANTPRSVVLPSLEKKIPPPPTRHVPTAYERQPKLLPLSSGITLELIQRKSTHLDLFFLDKDGQRVQIPPHLELVNCADMRPVSAYSIRPDMPYSYWRIVKSDRYALVDLEAGKVVFHLKFCWDIRPITQMHAA